MVTAILELEAESRELLTETYLGVIELSSERHGKSVQMRHKHHGTLSEVHK